MDEATVAAYTRQAAKLSTSIFWKAKSGTNQIRLLPKPPDEVKGPDDMCMTEIRTHFRVGLDSKATLCNALANQPCAICEFIEAQIAAGNAESIKDIQPSTQFNFHVLDLAVFDANAAEYQTQIWSATPAQTREIIQYIIDPDWREVFSAHNGKVCVVEKVEKGGNVRYNIRFNPPPHLIDMTRVKYAKSRTFDSYEDQKAMLSGTLPSTIATTSSPAIPPQTQVATPFPATPPQAATMLPAPMPATPIPVTVAPVPAQTITAPPSSAAPVPQVTLPPPPIAAEAKYWVAHGGVTLPDPMLTSEVKAHMIKHGINSAGQHLMNFDKTGGWKTAAEFGL